jgi:hypothetical protein
MGINSSGRPHFPGRGQGRGNTDTTHLPSEVVKDPNAVAADSADSAAGVGAENNQSIELDSSGQENPSAATFDGKFSGGRFSGRGRGRGRMVNIFIIFDKLKFNFISI